MGTVLTISLSFFIQALTTNEFIMKGQNLTLRLNPMEKSFVLPCATSMPHNGTEINLKRVSIKLITIYGGYALRGLLIKSFFVHEI